MALESLVQGTGRMLQCHGGLSNGMCKCVPAATGAKDQKAGKSLRKHDTACDAKGTVEKLGGVIAAFACEPVSCFA